MTPAVAETTVAAQLSDEEEFEEARAEYFKRRVCRKELISRYDKLQLELNLASMPGPPYPERAASVFRQAGAGLALARRNPRRSENELFDLRDQIEDGWESFSAAKQRYDAACAVRAERVARALVPRHRAAVAKIHAALTQLSAALAEEVGVRDEFEKSSPLPGTSHLLPSMSSEFMKVAWLPHWDSTASVWIRAARAKGLLDQNGEGSR